MRRRLSLLLLVLTIALELGACAKKKRTLFLPAKGTSLDIALAFAPTMTWGDICGDSHAYLLSVGLGTGASTSFDYRFLLGTNGELFGCPGGGCGNTRIAADLSTVRRIMVEGVDASPATYPSAPLTNVICRGVADLDLGMGSIDVTTFPTPSPSSSASEATTATLSISVPMLRIGDTNPLFLDFVTHDSGQFVGAWDRDHAPRTDSGGRSLLAGGQTELDFYEFDPAKIGFTDTGVPIARAREHASMTAFEDSAGTPSMLVCGGDPNLLSHPNDCEVYRQGLPVTELIVPFADERIGFSSVTAPVPDFLDGATPRPAIALIGGCEVSGGGAYIFNSREEYFFATGPTDLSTCTPGSRAGGMAVCRSTTLVPNGGMCEFNGASVTVGGANEVLVAFGEDSSNTIAGNPLGSGRAYLFDAAARTFSSPFSDASSLPRTHAIAALRSSSSLIYFGGEDPTTSPTTGWGVVDAQAGVVREGNGNMTWFHAGGFVGVLLDGRALIMGDSFSTSQNAIEVFVPGTVETDGHFGFLSRHAGASCGDGTAAGCVSLRSPRHGRPSATRITGSRTWINGGLLITGDGGALAPAGELFVPAYSCIGTLPGTVSGSSIAEADFCDRLRAHQEITDPSGPQIVSQ